MEEMMCGKDGNIVEQAFSFLEKNAFRFIKNTPENQSFIIHPDAPVEHKPEWHQFGIITHTRWVAYHYENTMQRYLNLWGVDKKVNAYLGTKIDGLCKKNLLELSIPFHDLGKFTGRFFKNKNGHRTAYFDGHEKLSESLVRENDDIQRFFSSIGLSDVQIDYVAKCVGLHYSLGKIRDIINSQGYSQFTMAFARGRKCKEYCIACMEKHPDFKVEMGLLFFCDSLAKTDIILDVNTDEEIISKQSEVVKMVAERGMHPNMVNSIKQIPVYIAFTRTYLELISYNGRKLKTEKKGDNKKTEIIRLFPNALEH